MSRYAIERSESVRILAGGLVKLRGPSDNLPQQWWVASTAIPLVAATIGPLSNVLSIAALVTPWRVTLPDGGIPSSSGRGLEDAAVGIADPKWELVANAFSLACGFAGNLFLLLHFTSRVRYIIALPLAILCWILSAIIIYSQGFWHAVLASILYFIGSAILTINIIGYFRGHYPQQFDLDDDQRTLILQTTTFFFWLAGGSGVFCALEGFTYVDALYYADVSVLTIGFGDFAPKTDPGRGFLFVFQLIGIIFLGLVISSINRFAANISADKIIKQHQIHARESTVGRTVTSERELRERLGLPPRPNATATDGYRLSESGRRGSLAEYGRIEIVGRTVTFHENKRRSRGSIMRGRETSQEKRKRRRQKLLLLEKEKDRFDAMRQIQQDTRRWKQYWALGMALLAFGVLWCLGAFVFMLTEAQVSELRYFECFYLCFVSLLTIGYGDFAPKSNVGKPFFIVWSLVAVPIVTLLIQEMSRTIVSAVNRGTFKLADWTIMPRKGVLKHFLASHPGIRDLLTKKHKPVFEVQNPDQDLNSSTVDTETTKPLGSEPQENDPRPTATQDSEVTEHDLARQLAVTIKTVAHDLRSETPKRYSYDEWEHFTKLIQFSRQASQDEEEDGLIEWDWIGEDSPLLADITEAEWVLDRLCESLNRYTRWQAEKVSVEICFRCEV
ncbi:hypothetical protein B0H67DRAFT_488799 [Lasiosphaeris hirsuta]|uniref:Potassium channel domain-containing protein n=1 Tax=Lasiosphaeris hirsuta TaxID=260670 RepID=A0AA40DTD8_9PEZI|nr:hypothetical protein B0H67DRAFT_488799 [Lasiosphaeris hirsuta]